MLSAPEVEPLVDHLRSYGIDAHPLRPGGKMDADVGDVFVVDEVTWRAYVGDLVATVEFLPVAIEPDPELFEPR